MESKRSAILSLLHADWTPTAISKHLGVARNMVYKAKKAEAAWLAGTAKPKKGRPRTATAPRAAAAVLRKICTAPTKPLRQIAQDMEMTHTAVNSIVKEAGFCSLRKKKIPLLSEVHRTERVVRGTALLLSLIHI